MQLQDDMGIPKGFRLPLQENLKARLSTATSYVFAKNILDKAYFRFAKTQPSTGFSAYIQRELTKALP
jgi:hypothetical protein